MVSHLGNRRARAAEAPYRGSIMRSVFVLIDRRGEA